MHNFKILGKLHYSFIWSNILRVTEQEVNSKTRISLQSKLLQKRIFGVNCVQNSWKDSKLCNYTYLCKCTFLSISYKLFRLKDLRFVFAAMRMKQTHFYLVKCWINCVREDVKC
jgi:hypothetical protein